MSDRFDRQRLLVAVGEQGQARISAARYAVVQDGGWAAEIQREYLTRAGAESFSAVAEAPAFRHAAVFKHAAAQTFAEGAWRALVQLMTVLEQGK